MYQNRLIKLRRREVKRVLEQCKAYGSADHWESVIDMHIDEAYLVDWFRGLYVKAGLPKAKSTARDMSIGKASPEEGYWENELLNYANERAGNEIVLLQGTFKDNLINITRTAMANNPQMPIEKLAQTIYAGYKEIELWQARRIAQTETMIGLASAGEIAARSMDVRYDKQWVISGLGNTRETHEAMDGIIVDMDEPFSLSDCMMMHPHDSSLGAPASEIINCACDILRIPKAVSHKTGFGEAVPSM